MSPVIETNKKVVTTDDRPGKTGLRRIRQILSLSELPGEDVRHRAGTAGLLFASALNCLAMGRVNDAIECFVKLGASNEQASKLVKDAVDGLTGTRLTFNSVFKEKGNGSYNTPVYQDFELTPGKISAKRKRPRK